MLSRTWLKPISVPKKMNGAMPAVFEQISESGFDGLTALQATPENLDKSLFDILARSDEPYNLKTLKEAALQSSTFRSALTEFALLDRGGL